MRHRHRPLLPAILFLRGFAAGSAEDRANVTYNGCKCKKTWQEGATHCNNYCCAPDADKWGKWCMVESVECEDSDWGYCFDWGPVRGNQPASGCADVPDWRDSDGDTCFSYQSNVWCTRSGGEGHGWHTDEWGPLASFSANGYSALTACCACGGGNSGVPKTRYTYSLCKCKTSWQMGDLTCQSSCCNPDDDVSGSWCMVEDFNCEDEAWGYCRPPSGSPPPAAAPSPIGRHGHCNDTADWRDIDGESCQAYADYAYCTEVGGYGLGWNIEWGSFSGFASDGVNGADVACCACGGGRRDPLVGWDPSDQLTNWDSEKVKTTWNGCECKRSWSLQQVRCESYCCGEDNWCAVKDTACEGAAWGYCRTSGLGTVARPQFDAAHCVDVAWVDKDGDSCEAYSKWAWCTATGNMGSGWHKEWGSIADAKSEGHTAFTACCACGGGNRDGGDEPGIVEQVRSFMREDHTFMWRVISGPCTMDSKGCIMSGNFPRKYSPEEQCQIAVDNEKATPIQVVSFDTEQHYDVLRINGVMYSGGKKPNGVVPKGTIHWGADRMDGRSGWKLCPRGGRARNPVVRVIKVLGIILLVLLLCCCLAVVGLWIHMKRRMPTGDGLGAGPIGIGKKYAKQADQVG